MNQKGLSLAVSLVREEHVTNWSNQPVPSTEIQSFRFCLFWTRPLKLGQPNKVSEALKVGLLREYISDLLTILAYQNLNYLIIIDMSSDLFRP